MSTITASLRVDAGGDELRNSAESFAPKASPLSRARSLRNSDYGFDRAFWQTLAEQGWTGLLAPENCTGFAQGIAQAACVIEVLAAQLVPEPFVPAVVFAGRAIEFSGNGSVHKELLRGLVDGSIIPVVAFDETPAGLTLDVRPSKVFATVRADTVVLSGTKFHVRAALGADGFVVSALDSDLKTAGLYWVSKSAVGVEIDPVRLADGSTSGTVHFKEVEIPIGNILSTGDVAIEALARAFDEALAMTAVELLSIQRVMFNLTQDYLRTRVQFGQTIGSFQALQHRAVDMLLQKEIAESVVGEVVSRLNGSDKDFLRSRECSRAKARAGTSALHIAKESIQLHGAIGFTDELDLSLYFQRTLVLSAWLGNSLMHRRRYSHLAKPQEETLCE